MCKKWSMTKGSTFVNSLNRIATSTANTLTATTFSLETPGGALRYLVPKCPLYYSCVYSLFPSKKFSIGLICGGDYTWSKASVREMVDLSVGGGL